MQTDVLRRLVRESHYAVDPALVAEAIVARAAARRIVPGISFRSSRRERPVRSFRPSRQARSFRRSDSQIAD
jgi:hypothetical protein